MKRIKVSQSVSDSAECLIKSLKEKGFKIFCDIDHQANAKDVDLEMPASRVLIFGNPVAGTKLMQKDITMSFDLPLRVAIVDNGGETLIVHQTSEDYSSNYQVENHPVLKKVEELFVTLVSEL
ncbi:MAG: DUF302 domain-containing protein [Gammaproteobacteria bacterium]|nr:DUF302 domain-containing protein [Gammaproteobacteria bacterium]